jgi:hypothetical protein
MYDPQNRYCDIRNAWSHDDTKTAIAINLLCLIMVIVAHILKNKKVVESFTDNGFLLLGYCFSMAVLSISAISIVFYAVKSIIP